MWIVRLALRRPYTFIVMAILIAIMGSLSIVTTPTDIFPYINIPIVGVIWSYSGMSPDDMARYGGKVREVMVLCSRTRWSHSAFCRCTARQPIPERSLAP